MEDWNSNTGNELNGNELGEGSDTGRATTVCRKTSVHARVGAASTDSERHAPDFLCVLSEDD